MLHYILYLYQLTIPEQTDPSCQKCLPLLYFLPRIHDLFLLSTADQAMTGQLLSPRFFDSKPNYTLFLVSFHPAFTRPQFSLKVFSKMKNKCQLFLCPFSVCRRNYNQHTCSSLTGDT